MGIHVPGRDKSFDHITNESSREEKIDAIFKWMITQGMAVYLPLEKMHLKYSERILFTSAIENTGFVSKHSTTGQDMYSLKSQAIAVLDKYEMSYLKYLEFIQSKKPQ